MKKQSKVRKTVSLPAHLYAAAQKRIATMKEVNWSSYVRLLIAKEVSEKLIKPAE